MAEAASVDVVASGVHAYASVRYCRTSPPLAPGDKDAPLTTINWPACATTTGRMRPGPGNGGSACQLAPGVWRSSAMTMFDACEDAGAS